MYALVHRHYNIRTGALKILNTHQYILLYYMHHCIYYKTHVPVQIIYRKAPEKKTSTTNSGYLEFFSYVEYPL